MHENTKEALLLIENFIDEYGDHIPNLNVEVTNDSAEVHINITTVEDLGRVHGAFGIPKWEVSASTDTSASATVGKVRVTIYYSAIRDEPDAQAPLRAIGLVKGLVAL
jgi:hypothetical protein